MEGMRRTLLPLVIALAMVALTAAGCGNGAAGMGHTATTSRANSAPSTQPKAVRFAECMRANGVSAFPDPNASGDLTIDAVANGSSVDTSSTAFKQALSACRGLEPAGFTGGKVTPSQRTARLEFAQCMRDNGVPDFPDPTPTGPLIDTNRIPSLAGKDVRTDPGMQSAMQKCAKYASAAGVRKSP
jgi:hypothetical protein